MFKILVPVLICLVLPSASYAQKTAATSKPVESAGKELRSQTRMMNVYLTTYTPIHTQEAAIYIVPGLGFDFFPVPFFSVGGALSLIPHGNLHYHHIMGQHVASAGFGVGATGDSEDFEGMRNSIYYIGSVGYEYVFNLGISLKFKVSGVYQDHRENNPYHGDSVFPVAEMAFGLSF